VVLVEPFFGLRCFEGRSSFAGWLQRIKINHCLDHLRKQSARSFVGIEEQHVQEFDQLKDLATADNLPKAISDQQLISAVGIPRPDAYCGLLANGLASDIWATISAHSTSAPMTWLVTCSWC